MARRSADGRPGDGADPTPGSRAADGGDDPDRRRALAAWLRPRIRIVGTAVLTGAGFGAVLAVALAASYDPSFAARKGFGVGLLALGFGVVGWSGSVIAGPGMENLQRHLDTGTDWSEAESRRAMVRVASAGLGVALAVPPVARLLGA